jgi:hypothetical protein
MEPMVELDIPDVVPCEEDGPFELRGVLRFHEEILRGQGHRDRILEDGVLERWNIDQDTAEVREAFAERGLNLSHPVVASTVLITVAMTRGRAGQQRAGKVAVAATEAIERLSWGQPVDDAASNDAQLRLFD